MKFDKFIVFITAIAALLSAIGITISKKKYDRHRQDRPHFEHSRER